MVPVRADVAIALADNSSCFFFLFHLLSVLVAISSLHAKGLNSYKINYYYGTKYLSLQFGGDDVSTLIVGRMYETGADAPFA